MVSFLLLRSLLVLSADAASTRSSSEQKTYNSAIGFFCSIAQDIRSIRAGEKGREEKNRPFFFACHSLPETIGRSSLICIGELVGGERRRQNGMRTIFNAGWHAAKIVVAIK
jgi:hypothetical protein